MIWSGETALKYVSKARAPALLRISSHLAEIAPNSDAITAPSALRDGYLAALRTRSTTVTLIDSESTQTQPNGRHRWSIIAVAAAVVAIVVGALLLVARDDSEPVVPADTTVVPGTAEPQVPADITVVPEVLVTGGGGSLDGLAATLMRSLTNGAGDEVSDATGVLDGLV